MCCSRSSAGQLPANFKQNKIMTLFLNVILLHFFRTCCTWKVIVFAPHHLPNSKECNIKMNIYLVNWMSTQMSALFMLYAYLWRWWKHVWHRRCSDTINNCRGSGTVDRHLEEILMLTVTVVRRAEHITCQLWAWLSDGHFIFSSLSHLMLCQPKGLPWCLMITLTAVSFF